MRPLLISMMLAATLAAAPKIENGLYHIQESGGVTVKSMKGGEVHLGKRLENKIETAIIRSGNNANSLYHVWLKSAEGISEDYRTVALCVDGQCLCFNMGGKNKIGAEWVPEAAAVALAKHFEVKLLRRKHPHHEMLVKFAPEKEEFKVGELLGVKVTIKNVGTTPFTFQVGGKNRGVRDNQFSFTAQLYNHPIPDTGDPTHFGGMFVDRTLKPGESFEAEVDLRKWFKLEEPGTYTIKGTYSMDFHDPDAKDHLTIWEDYATAEFWLTIEK